jgi:hypothetical protein
MERDDDVERLFSWLQTPELRYREFAGAREITDSVVTLQTRPNTAEAPLAAAPERPVASPSAPDPYEGHIDTPPEPLVRRIEPAPPIPAAPVPPPAAGPFALGAGGRGIPRRPEYTEPVVQPPLPAPATPVAQSPVPPRPAVEPVAPPALPQPAAANPPGGRLFGGAYTNNGQVPDPVPVPPENQERTERSLDAVFGRLAGGRNPLPDPRDRLRHIPGLGPPGGRPR